MLKLMTKMLPSQPFSSPRLPIVMPQTYKVGTVYLANIQPWSAKQTSKSLPMAILIMEDNAMLLIIPIKIR